MTQHSPPGELTHYGKKGMKWGVRKARTGDLDKLASSQERVAAGTGSTRDKVKAFGTSSTIGLARRGLKGEASKNATKNRQEIERLSTGKATATDLIRAYGNTSLRSIMRSRKDD